MNPHRPPKSRQGNAKKKSRAACRILNLSGAALLGVLLGIGTPAVAWADPMQPLHELFPLETPTEHNPAWVGSQDHPVALRQGDRIFPKPPLNPKTSKRASTPSPFYVPDRNTTEDATLQYAEVFAPPLVPFKRSMALNAAREDGTLTLQSRTFQPLTTKTRPDSRDRLYWGQRTLRLTSNGPTRIDSVSPNMKIVSVESTPQLELEFSKDEADNFYVESKDGGAHQQVHIRFLAAVPRAYFSDQVPDDLRLEDFPVLSQSPLPSELRTLGKRAARLLKIKPRQSVSRILKTLAAYFRAYDATPPPPKNGPIFWDLFKQQIGVCRHRAYAFFVTANAIGIPTRYVFNEVHAWVEVWTPATDWVRFDLGGAANGIETLPMQEEDASASDRTPPRPLSVDPFLPAETNSDVNSKQPVTLQISDIPKEGYRGSSIRLEGSAQDARGVPVSGLLVDLYLVSIDETAMASTFVGQATTTENGRFTVQARLPLSLKRKPYEVVASTPGTKLYRPALSP